MANNIVPAVVRMFQKQRRMLRLVILSFAVMICGLASTGPAEAACLVPNQISNGQIADATAVMNDFNAVKACIDAAVAPSGSPTTGSLPVFSGPNTVTSGNLSGDCNTSGALVVTCTKTAGTSFGPLATSTDAGQLTGTISVNRFSNGVNADTTHFLRGDGQWAIPPGTGTGGASATPVLRASNMTTFNANSVTISWPAGTVAGDVVIIFVSDGYAVNNPSGWTVFNNSGSNDWANGLTAAKVMTAADITAGNVTVTLIGPYSGVAAAATLDGSTVNGVQAVIASRSSGSSSYASTAISGLYQASDANLILGFTYSRGAMNPSISNFTQLQLANTGNASAFLGQYATTFSKLGFFETATYPAGNNGYYWCVVAIR